VQVAAKAKDVLVGPIVGVVPRAFTADVATDLVNPLLSPDGALAAAAGPSFNPAMTSPWDQWSREMGGSGGGGCSLAHLGIR
jgi:hypothetical protein